MTLYLKYRPKNLDELDLPEVGESLKKIVQSSSIPHAFLFAGPKGTGKTSAARILAKIINCEDLSKNGIPCDKCEQCISTTRGNNLDVIEMDAASHRGIDDVRVLKDAVKLAPTKSKKKIYIIDEAHMLTTEASNALLKTLEEPPPHVIFILATTNPEKLIDTIRSRATLIAFRKAGVSEIVRSLKRVVESEKVKVSDDSLTKIAEAANGAFRDAIKILEQVVLEGETYLDSFQKSDTSSFVDYLVKKDEKSAILEVEKSITLGISMENFLESLLTSFHLALLSEVGINDKKIKGLSKEDLITLTDLFTTAAKNLTDSPIEALPPEIAVIKWCGLEMKTDDRSMKTDSERDKKVEDGIAKKSSSAPAEEEKEEKVNPHTNNLVNEVDTHAIDDFKNHTLPMDQVIGVGVNDDIWKSILLAVRPINASIEGLLRSSKPVGYDGKTLTLGVFYKFHKERLEDTHHRKILEDVIEKILNTPTRVVCTLVEPPPKIVIQESTREPILTETRDQDIIKIAEDIFSN